MTKPKTQLPACYVPGPRYKRMCFFNALEHVRLNPAFRAVHGIVQPPFAEAGGSLGHAWVEVDHEGAKWVYDPSLNEWMTATKYASLMHVQYRTTYTWSQLEHRLKEFQNSGPWDERVSAAGFARREGRRIVVAAPP